MKWVILLCALCINRIASEPPSGPYAPSGWRPNGPILELPQKQKSTAPGSYQTSNQEQNNPSSEYGIPNDLSVQGLAPRQPNQPGQSNQPDQFNQQGQFHEPGQFNQPKQFSQQGQFKTPVQFSQQDQFNQPGQFNHPGQFNQQGKFDQQDQFNQPGQYNKQGAFNQDKSDQPKQLNQQGQFNQPDQFDQLGQFNRPVEFNPPGQFVRPVVGQLVQGSSAQGQFSQGVPVQEPTPLFMVSPVNGMQYVGTAFNADLRLLEEQLRQQEALKQRFSNFDNKQNQFEKVKNESNDYDDFQSPRIPSFGKSSTSQAGTAYGAPSTETSLQGFGSQTTVSPTRFGQPGQSQTKGSFGQNSNSENPGRDFNNFPTSVPAQSYDNKDSKNETPQSNVQSLNYQTPANYPNQLAQLALQQQYISPFSQQIGQLHLPIIYQPAQAYTNLPDRQLGQSFFAQLQNFVPGNPANLAAVDLTIAQRQTALTQPQQTYPSQGSEQSNPTEADVQYNPKGDQKFNTREQEERPDPSRQQGQQSSSSEGQTRFNPSEEQIGQINPSVQSQFNSQQIRPTQEKQTSGPSQNNLEGNTHIYPQVTTRQSASVPRGGYRSSVGFGQQQPGFGQQQPGLDQQQQDFGLQQPGFGQQQPGFGQPQSEFGQQQSRIGQRQPGFGQPQPGFDQLQPGFGQPEQPGSLQSVFNVNQQGNGLDSRRPKTDEGQQDDDDDEESAYAQGFGDRIPARSFSVYGTPVRPQTKAVDADQPPVADAEASPTEDTPTVAVANAVADGRKRKSSKLRSRRIRPLYTVDKYGELVQLQ